MTRLYRYMAISALSLFAISFLAVTPAEAHRFNVALIAPSSGWDSTLGRNIFKRFLVATTERDGHADEESDGHLGGLDVYVTLADRNKNIISNVGRGLPWAAIDIEVRFTKAPVEKNRAILIVPENTPDVGYNAAKIIDKSVRAQGGIDDLSALQQNFMDK